MSRIDALNEWVIRVQISAKQRSKVYNNLALLLESRVALYDALDKLRDIHSLGGTKPNVPLAVMIDAWRSRIALGSKFANAIRDWVSPEEAALIAAGERSGNLREAFNDAMRLIGAKSAIVMTIALGFAYPVFLAVLIAGVLTMIATMLVPVVARIVPPETWEGTAAILYAISQYTLNYGIYTAVAIIAIVVLIVFSFPRLRGNLRYHLDRFPPWSIYRAVVGASFLLNVSVMVRAGVSLLDAVELLAKHANPYLRERLDATIQGIERGDNFGEALLSADYAFPDPEAIAMIRAIAVTEGFDLALTKFADEWLQEVTQRVRAAMAVIVVVGVLTAGSLTALVAVSFFDIQETIEAQTDSRYN
jgi:type II secretory pathway component PulF